MAHECTKCGHTVPEGQFRCGRCGTPHDADESENDLLVDAAASAPAPAPDHAPANSPLARAEVPPPMSDEDGQAGTAPANEPPHPGAVSEDITQATMDVQSPVEQEDESALSLPPTPIDTQILELNAARSVPPRNDETQEGAPPEGGRDEDADRRGKIVPKGAFGDDSVEAVAEAPPEAAASAEAEANPGELTTSAAPPARTRGKDEAGVEQLPGLEPTRHRDGEDEEEAEAEEASSGDTPSANSSGPAASEEPPLELDVPSGGLRSLPNKPRPPFLASETMREDILPERPGRHLIALLARSCGGAAVLSYLAFSSVQAQALVWAVPALVLLALGTLRLSYVQRAASVALLTVATLTFSGFEGASPVPSPAFAALPFVVLWLSASLLLRSWYRGHREPPWMVAVGVVVATALAVTAPTVSGEWVIHDTWQSWLPSLLLFLYANLCLLSLLAFMGPESGAGGEVWAVCWSLWFALTHLGMTLVTHTPSGASPSFATLAEGATQGAFINIFLLPPGALALAQLYAVGLRRREPATDDPHVEAAAAED